VTPVPYLGLHEPVSALTHSGAAVLALYGLWKLVLKAKGEGQKVGAALLYGGCLLFLFSMSGTYHSLPPGHGREFFRRLDYMGIWLVIAGSATPIHILLMRGFWRWGMLALVWSASLASLVVTDLWQKDMSYGAIVAFYIAVASLGLLTFWRLNRRFSARTLLALPLGGAFYITGAVMDALEGPVLLNGVLGPHELFHLFVVAGAACHYLFIYGWADLRLRKVRAVAGAVRRSLPAAGEAAVTAARPRGELPSA
jgi:channel protein (hemolysin III family)